MKMGRDRRLRLQDVQGVERPTGLTACMETGGNEADGNPEGRWATDLCQSERARWVLMLQSAGS